MITVSNLCISYGKKNIINNFNYVFLDKGLYVIKGNNGSGKTTLLKALANLIKFQGNISYNLVDIKEYKSDLYKNFCYIDQFGNLIDNLSGNENYKIINNLLDSNIESVDKKLTKLSSGQRKTEELKRLDIDNYQVFLLDEISTSLDKKHKENLILKLKEISKAKLVIMVTHDSDFIDIADNVIDIESKYEDTVNVSNEKYDFNYRKSCLNYKIVFSNLFTKILLFIFTTFFLFGLNMFINLSTYSDQKAYGEYLNYSHLIHVEKKNRVEEYVSDYQNTDVLSQLTFSLDSPNTNELVIVFNKQEEVVISDYASHSIFNDKNKHIGDSINLHGDKIVNVTIDKYQDTIFSTDKYIDDYSYTLINYIVVPYSYLEELYDLNTDRNIYFYVFDKNDVRKDYQMTNICLLNSETTNKVNVLKISMLILSIFSLIIAIYLYTNLALVNKKKMNNMFKLKSLGVPSIDLKRINSYQLIFTLLIPLLLSNLSYIFLNQFRIVSQSKLTLNLGISEFSFSFLSEILLFVLVLLMFTIGYRKFKKAIEVA
jgi:ABC-type lipoprotein export system ATPase subunit